MAKQKSRFPSYGLVRGPSHKHGGVAGVVAGEQPVELEGGEWIIPKEVVPDYLPVLKQITNEGRAIQQMDNGNSAMDALIVSASMQTGLAKPKSPMYQEGGNVLKLRPTDAPSYDEIVQGFQVDPFPGSGYEYPFEKEKQYRETGEYWSDEPSYLQLLNWQLSQLPESDEDFENSHLRKLQKIKDSDEAKGKDWTKNPRAKKLMGSSLTKRILDDRKEERLMEQSGREFQAYQRERLPYADVPPAPEFKVSPLEKLQHYINKALPKQQGGPVYQEGGEIDYSKTSGLYNRFLAEQDSPEIMGMKDILLYRAMQNPETASAELYDKQSDVGRQFSKDALLTKALLNAIGMEGATESDSLRLVNALSPAGRRLYEGTYAKEQKHGGPIKQYGHGGQALPRKQQEMRGAYIDPQDSSIVVTSPYQGMLFDEAKENIGWLPGTPQSAMTKTILDIINRPQVYNMPSEKELRKKRFIGPPIEMMGPMPTDTSAVDTTGNALQHMLNQLMMRDVNQNINPFTGDTIDTYLDSLQLEGSKRKSLIPRSAGRKKSKHGGPVMYQEGGMVGQPQAMGPVPQGSLMGAANGDVRIRPLTPDTYITKLGEDGSSTMEIPKLSTAYLQSFGMETPLSKQQGASLHQKGITPDTLNPSVKGLINRVLVQRLANEDE